MKLISVTEAELCSMLYQNWDHVWVPQLDLVLEMDHDSRIMIPEKVLVAMP